MSTPFDIPTAQPGAGVFVGHRNYLTSTAGQFARPIKFAGTTYDTDNMYDTASGVITIPSDGTYCFSFQLICDQSINQNSGLVQPVLYNTTPGINSNNLLNVADFISQMPPVSSAAYAIFYNSGSVNLQCSAGEIYIWSNERGVGSFRIQATNAGINQAGHRSYIETHKI